MDGHSVNTHESRDKAALLASLQRIVAAWGGQACVSPGLAERIQALHGKLAFTDLDLPEQHWLELSRIFLLRGVQSTVVDTGGLDYSRPEQLAATRARWREALASWEALVEFQNVS